MCSGGMPVLRIAGQVFLFASFSIPSDSMVPVLRPGDYVLVDKPLKGARIFDVWDAAEHRPFEIRRLPGLEEFRRGEVLVFNFPYPERWDSIGFDVLLYYVKRCIGGPGDTVEIRDGRYRVRGTDTPAGNVEAQERLSRLLSKKSGREEGKGFRPVVCSRAWRFDKDDPEPLPVLQEPDRMGAAGKVGAKGRWLLFGG